MNLRSRARKLFGRELAENTVKATKVDHAVFHDVVRRAPKLAERVQSPPTLKSEESLNARVWEKLAEDLWSEFYGEDEPALRARDKIAPEFRVNRELADKQARDDQFRETRSMTRGQVTESAIGLMGALDSMAQSYGEELSEHAERQHEIAERQDEISSIDEMLESIRACIDAPDNPGDVEGNVERARELGKQKREAVNALKAAVTEQQMHAGDLIDAARKAVAIAADKAKDAVECASLLPGKGAGPGQRVNTEQMLEFAARVGDSSVLAAVLDMMGRLELSMGTARRTLRKGGYEEMVDIETGDDLRLVLPAEKALLTHPIGKLDFYRRFHERSLMQYEMWSEQELKRGPVIFAADGSSSMRGAKNVFCRGLTLASCAIGNGEGRNTAAIEFGSKGQLREFFFPGDRPLDTETALDFAEHFFAGGTDINQCLVRAKELIDSEAPFHSADLVIVTDGGDILTEQSIELRDALRAMGVKIHGLVVGIRPTPYMIEVCDKTTGIVDFAGPNETSNRLAIDLS